MEPNEQQNQNNPQVVKPESMFQPSVPYQAPQPPSQPQAQTTPPQPSEEPEQPSVDGDVKKRRILIVIIAGLIGFFIILVIIVLLTSSGNKSNKSQTDQNSQSTGVFSPPTALDIQNANNSITSDITSLNDDSDFPTANLSDTNLQL